MTPKSIMDVITTIRGFKPNKFWVRFESKSASREEFERFVKTAEASPILLEALTEITKGEGAFSRDQLTHANNTIENMIKIAEAAISKVGV